MVAELVAAGVLLFVAAAELLHAGRCRRLAALAFGPGHRPRVWARSAPVVRVVAFAALAWGLLVLLTSVPKVHKSGAVTEGEIKHIVLVLDVSPSMRLTDAGPTAKQSRMQRAKDVLESFFQRVVVEQYRLSVVATYTGAKPVVLDTKDIEVVRNILSDLPMHHAFEAGKTDVFAGLTEAARIAKPWQPNSTTVILVSDGDTVPAAGMPRMPAAVAKVLVVGIGDPVAGRFIDGKQSRQDRSTLQQIAVRLNGIYHDGNQKHLSSEILQQITETGEGEALARLTKREFALVAVGVGALVMALLPLLLHWLGTAWQPGTNRAVSVKPPLSLTA